jgi:hypothetical protein
MEEKTDHSAWSREKLIERATALGNELKGKNQRYNTYLELLYAAKLREKSHDGKYDECSGLDRRRDKRRGG